MTARGTYDQEGENVYLWKNIDNSYEFVPSERWRRPDQDKKQQRIKQKQEIREQMEKIEQLVAVVQVLQLQVTKNQHATQVLDQAEHHIQEALVAVAQTGNFSGGSIKAGDAEPNRRSPEEMQHHIEEVHLGL